MQITCINFGGFTTYTRRLESLSLPNGSGKTTLINAYLFALTGRNLNGFEPRRIDAPDAELTEVTLTGFCGLPPIRRTLTPAGGATLYVSGDAITQTDFKQVCAARGIDLDFVATCGDANVLTDPALTSDDLRKLLVRADVLDNGESSQLRKEAEDVRKRLKSAERYALSNVTIPARTVEPLTESENEYGRAYVEAIKTFNYGVPDKCTTCGREYDAAEKAARIRVWEEAERIVRERADEAGRIAKKRIAYEEETRAIADAQRLIDTATKARADVARLNARLKEIDATLRELDAAAVRAELPDGVEIITEQTSKTGTTKSVCTLTWNGVPLKSVNRAKRIEICVRLLEQARENKGMLDVPIIVDNAESVQGLDDVYNLIKLTVGTPLNN